MRAVGIVMARQHLSLATQNLNAMTGAKNFEHAKRLWVGFLDESQKFFNKLQAGSKETSSKQWADTLSHERRLDPLLSYLHHARHTAEHTLAEVFEEEFGVATQVMVSGMIKHMVIKNGEITQLDIPKNTAVCVRSGPASRLRVIPFVNRNTRYEVPTTHLAQRVHLDDPVYIGNMAVKYMEMKLSEAASLVAE